MIVWWKFHRVLWTTEELRQTGLLDYALKPYAQGELPNQLRLWIGNP